MMKGKLTAHNWCLSFSTCEWN